MRRKLGQVVFKITDDVILSVLSMNIESILVEEEADSEADSDATGKRRNLQRLA